jgi:DNA polymerase alpha subunit B N-terminal
LASTLQVTPTQMAECWEAYSLNKNLKQLDEHSFSAFRLQLCKESDAPLPTAEDGAIVARPNLTKKRDATSVVITPAHKKRQASADESRNSSGNRRVSLSPNPPLSLQKPASTSSLAAYSDRQGSGKVVAEYNPSNLQPMESNSALSKPKCVISNDFPTNVQAPYQHMFTVLDERARILDDQLQEKHDEFCQEYNFGSEQIAGLEAVGVPRQDTICCIGRICNAVSNFYGWMHVCVCVLWLL